MTNKEFAEKYNRQRVLRGGLSQVGTVFGYEGTSYVLVKFDNYGLTFNEYCAIDTKMIILGEIKLGDRYDGIGQGCLIVLHSKNEINTLIEKLEL